MSTRAWKGRRSTLRVTCLLAFTPLPLFGQGAACSYDECALRVIQGPGSTRIVQGANGPTLPPGTFISRAQLLGASGDSVWHHYNAYLAAGNRTEDLGWLFAGATVGTTIYFATRPPREWVSPGGLIGTFATVSLGLLATRTAVRGDNRLAEAVWIYNRGLLRNGDGCPYDECALRVHSNWIVQGQSGTRIARYGSTIEQLVASGDSVRIHHDAYRQAFRRAQVSQTVARITALGGLVLIAATESRLTKGAGVGLLVLSWGAGHGRLYAVAEANNELNRAIWYYNRERR